MIGTLIYLLVLCLVLGVIWWIIGQIALPPPIRQIVTIVFVVIAVIVLIYFLLGLVGDGGLGLGGTHHTLIN